MLTNPVLRFVPTETDQLVIEAVFRGFSASDLYEYFVKPELLVAWWAPQADVEARPGGRYHLGWPDMDWHLRGECEEVQPAERLAFSWQWDHERELPPRRVDLRFEPVEQGCRLTLVHEPYDESERDQLDRTSHREGWTHFLGILAGLR